MADIQYIKGDATNPIGDGNKIIIHCCNDCGKWGAGFVLALSKRWKDPEVQYRKWSRGYIFNPPYLLGEVQFVNVETDTVVANMIGQHGVGSVNGSAPIRYPAIAKCLEKVAEVVKKYNCSIHAPRFGAGLAGGDWKIIEALIVKILCDRGIQVTIYDL